jgi:hypothetical protein
MDLKTESKETLDLYGCDPAKPSFARACLLARRMVERGVRFINIYHEGWDAHSDVAGNLKNPIAAPPTRPPPPSSRTSNNAGCSTKPSSSGAASSVAPQWSKPMPPSAAPRAAIIIPRPSPSGSPAAASNPASYGATDELGFHVVENPVHVHDLQATLLHCLGFDHERLTYTYQGRQFRLTDVHGHVVKPSSPDPAVRSCFMRPSPQTMDHLS